MVRSVLYLLCFLPMAYSLHFILYFFVTFIIPCLPFFLSSFLLYWLPFFDIHIFIYILHYFPLWPVSFSSSFFLTFFLPFSLSLWRRADFHPFHRNHTAIRNLGLIQQPNGFRITWTNQMDYFLLIHFNSKPLHVSSRLAAHHQEDQLCINSNWYSHAVFIQSWSSWWWAASLLETCRGLLLK